MPLVSSYVEDSLERDELVVWRGRISFLSYVGALLFFVLMMTPGRLSQLASTELALTDRRIIGKTGTVLRKTVALKFAEVETVRVQRGALGWMCNYGTIIVSGRDGTRVRFLGITEPLDFKRRVDEAMELAMLGRPLPRFGLE